MSKALALDIGGTKIAAAIVSDDGKLSERQQILTPRGDAALLSAALETLIAPFRNRIDFIGVASTGIIKNGHLTALNPFNLGGLEDFPLENCIGAISDLPCVLLNDGQASAWAEYQVLRDECDSALFTTVSTGVGGGIIWNKKLLIGHNGLAGHIGHTAFDPKGVMCGCGRRGCVESVASGSAIGAAMREGSLPVSAARVFELSRLGNAQAQQVVSRSALAIASMIADMHIALDLDAAILGGSVGLAEGYLEEVTAMQRQLPEVYRTPLKLGYYRQDSGLLGAALWARETL